MHKCSPRIAPLQLDTKFCFRFERASCPKKYRWIIANLEGTLGCPGAASDSSLILLLSLHCRMAALIRSSDGGFQGWVGLKGLICNLNFLPKNSPRHFSWIFSLAHPHWSKCWVAKYGFIESACPSTAPWFRSVLLPSPCSHRPVISLAQRRSRISV